MPRPDDETLMAFADDVLAEPERSRIAAYLESDPEARAVVEKFRRTRVLAREAFTLPADRPLPAGLVERILAAPLPEPAPKAAGPTSEQGSNVVPLRPRPARGQTASGSRLVAIAASLALLAGGIGGWIASGAMRSADDLAALRIGPLATSSTIARVLERQPSGNPLGSLLVVASFRDRHQRYCREIEILSARGNLPEVAAVACRQGDGGWIVEGMARLNVAESKGGTGYSPSGALEKDALQSLLSLLGAGAVLSASEEQTAITSKWK